MRHQPLRRHEALQPLSREHFNGLALARRLREAGRGDHAARAKALQELGAAWDNELEQHFEDEERLLADLVSEDMFRRLSNEHASLRALAQEMLLSSHCDGAAFGRLASMLQDHIRWEERELFPAAERAASPEDMARIAEHTGLIETIRPGSRKRAPGVEPFKPWDPEGSADSSRPRDDRTARDSGEAT